MITKTTTANCIKMSSYDGDTEHTVGHDSTSAASMRRLSWRRHLAAAKCKPFGRTFSLTTEQRATQVAEVAQKKTNQTLLERWLSSSAEARKLIDRRVCWSKESSKRGKYGESLLHVLIIQQKQQQQQQKQWQRECILLLIVILTHLFPRLTGDIFESAKFRGLNCLHLTIAYGNEQLLAYLLDCISDNKLTIVDGRVTGSLFRVPEEFAASEAGGASLLTRLSSSRRRVSPIIGGGEQEEQKCEYRCDQMRHWPTANGHAHLLLSSNNRVGGDANTSEAQNEARAATAAGRLIYLGDTPLAWSVSFGSRTMFECLLRLGGANLQTQDAHGHSCLHLLVINSQPGWSRFLIKSGLSAKLENGHGQTAFLMACRHGRAQLFDEFLELSAVDFWSYSMIRCCGYPLNELDSIQLQEDGSSDGRRSRSAVRAILESELSSNEQKSQLLSSAVVKKLLEEKWRLFARRLFYNNLLLALFHLLLLSVAIALRAPSHAAPTGLDRTRVVCIDSLAVRLADCDNSHTAAKSR